LKDFKKLLELHFNGPKHRLCGHNAKEFDFPFIARRMLIHQISLPQSLQLFNKNLGKYPILKHFIFGVLEILSIILL